MSEVISFRLDRNNPREALALQILTRWREEGYPLRQIFTEALLKYADPNLRCVGAEIFYEMNAKFGAIEHLLVSGGTPYKIATTNNTTREANSLLNETFITAIKSSAKPGMSTK